MLNYIKKKFERRKLKRKFKEYNYEIKNFHLAQEGEVKYAQWLNPFESSKEITQSNVSFFKKLVKKGDFAIDIGAHTGDTTIPLALAVGAEGLVLALDPNPIVFKILKVNSNLNKDKTRIIPLCFAATETDGDFFYNSSEATFNNGGVSKTKSTQHGPYTLKEKIKGINLENYLRKNYSKVLPTLSLIKIDAEGYDKEIIKSISKVIEDFKPCIITECFRKLKKEERYELYNTIEGKGYILYYLGEGFKASTKIKQINKNSMTNWKHFDICAIPKEKYSAVHNIVQSPQ